MQTRSRKVTSFSACKANGIASINKARGVSAINKAKGFTLIEVLVASFILFLVIGTVTITYSGAVKGTLSASEAVKLHSYVPLLAEHITLSVRAGERNGKDNFLDIQYEWKTQLLESKPVAQFYDQNSFQMQSSNKDAFLWQVLLTTTYNGRSTSYF